LLDLECECVEQRAREKSRHSHRAGLIGRERERAVRLPGGAAEISLHRRRQRGLSEDDSPVGRDGYRSQVVGIQVAICRLRHALPQHGAVSEMASGDPRFVLGRPFACCRY
jgi:hypothetical protein